MNDEITENHLNDIAMFASMKGEQSAKYFRAKIPLILRGQKALKDIEKYGFTSAYHMINSLHRLGRLNTEFEQKDKKLKEFLVKRIAELQKRLETWNNFSQAGQTAYSVVSVRCETYKEILTMISEDIQP